MHKDALPHYGECCSLTVHYCTLQCWHAMGEARPCSVQEGTPEKAQTCGGTLGEYCIPNTCHGEVHQAQVLQHHTPQHVPQRTTAVTSREVAAWPWITLNDSDASGPAMNQP